MGAWVSRTPPPAPGLGDDPRPLLPYASLQFLDLVLVRSAAGVTAGNSSSGGGGGSAASAGAESMDARIAAAIRLGALGLQLPSSTHLCKWDRVGLLQLPSFLERFEYSADNIEVTEATYSGVHTRSLRQVMDGALEVAIRPLYVGSQIKAPGAAGSQTPDAEHRDSVTSSSDSDALGSVASNASSGSSGDENSERLEFLQRYYRFTGPVVNRPYSNVMDKLESMFRWVMSALKRFDLSPEESARMDALLERHVEDYRAADGQMARGIPFARLIDAFRDMDACSAQANRSDDRRPVHRSAASDSNDDASALPPLSADSLGGTVANTFSDSEIFELVNAFTTGAGGTNADDRVSLSNTGHVSKGEFLSHWRASLERTQPLRRVPREILSGAFVSQALQQMGMLPARDDMYFLPQHFAMGEPPAEWTLAEGASRKDVEEQARRRAKVRAETEARRAHLPKLAPAPPAAAGASSSPAAAAPASASHASIAVASSGGGDDSSAEGVAILHIHAHGVARIGLEHQLPPPPPPEDDGQDHERT